MNMTKGSGMSDQLLQQISEERDQREALERAQKAVTLLEAAHVYEYGKDLRQELMEEARWYLSEALRRIRIR